MSGSEHSRQVSIPPVVWKRPFLKLLDQNFELTEEAREFFSLSETERSQVNGAIAEFEDFLKEQESDGARGYVTDGGGVVFKIEAWNDDYDRVRKNYLERLDAALGSRDDVAEVFAAQSANSFAATYGSFGTEPRFMKISPPNEKGEYLATIFTGGNVSEIDLDSLEGKWPVNLSFQGVKTRFERFKDIPDHLRHLLAEE